MEYFYYLSRSKIDSLLGSNISQNESKNLEHSLEEIKNIKIQNLLKNLINIKNNGLTSDQNQLYLEKLSLLLEKIIGECPLLEINRFSNYSEINVNSFYYYNGSFKITTPLNKETVANQRSIISIFSIPNSFSIQLECSLDNFASKGVNSSNYQFLIKERPLIFESIFMLFSKENNTLYGSPLFLKLSQK